VDIFGLLDTTFAGGLGRGQVTTAVTSTARGCGLYFKPLFNGHAVVGLNDNTSAPCGLDSWNGDWYITGSGLFSNGCAQAHKIVDLDNGKCVTSVGTASGFPVDVCLTPTTQKVNYPDDVLAIMPPNPCDGTAGDVGIPQPAGVSTFTNGIYCISNLDILDDEDITLNNATLYITDPTFDVKFAGGGGFYGTATKEGTFTGSEDFDDYYIVIPLRNPPCEDFNHGDQVIEWRGNGSGGTTGTILAPSSCLDLRGNGNLYAMNSQIIGYTVSSNGSAELHVNYNVANNHETPVYPTISLLK